MPNKRGGIINVKVNGQIYDAKGNYTYNFGRPKREGIPGADRVHGYKEMIQVPFIEGEITDRGDLNIDTLLNAVDATVTAELANGKTGVWKEAWYAADGDAQTEEGNIQFRFEAISADEI